MHQAMLQQQYLSSHRMQPYVQEMHAAPQKAWDHLDMHQANQPPLPAASAYRGRKLLCQPRSQGCYLQLCFHCMQQGIGLIWIPG